MVQRKILSVGFRFPDDDVDTVRFDSTRTLLDADIVIFEPGLGFFSYETKQNFSSSEEFDEVKSAILHWRAEVAAFLKEGKTLIIFLTKPQEIFYSGRKAREDTAYSSYSVFPFSIGRIYSKTGEFIKPASDLKYLSVYWKEFSEFSKFEVYLEGSNYSEIFLTTRTGSKVIGARMNPQYGNILLLPPIQYDIDEFTELDEEEEEVWSGEAVKFGKRLTASLIELDKALHGFTEVTPPPIWVENTEYRLTKELELDSKINGLNSEIDQLTEKKNEHLVELIKLGSLRRLLYETGHELEEAILDTLRLMGFKAELYKEGESEFDAVFVSPEGRFLGEAEGKDNKAVNIDKMRQLITNLEEDYAREEITEYAKGVLFGNAYRLSPLNERPEYFTLKCFSTASRAKAALVRTPDLFLVAKYLSEKNDEAYAKLCREAIMNAEGEIVQFPKIAD